MNYVHQVRRSNGAAKEVTANANGIYLTFIKGTDGRPREVSRHMDAMVYSPGALYVRKDTYAGVIRQVSAVLNEKPRAKPVGFVPAGPTVESECTKEPDNGRCPGCDKGTLDQSNCFESCPLAKE